MFSEKMPFSPRGSSALRNKLFLASTSLIIPNGNSIGLAVFVWVPNAMLYNALSMKKKTYKIASSPWEFVTLLKEGRAMARGNMHKKLIKIAL